MADGSLIFDTKVDTTGFHTGTNSIKKQAASVQSVFKKVGATIAAAFTIKEIVQFGKEATALASDLQEVQNVVDTAFGSMAYKMEEFAATCIKNYGISKLTAKEMGSTFMAMAKGMGQATDIASDKAVELTGRLGDIMSFYNKTASEANTIGKAIYTGETEPLKAIGVVMTETNLNAYALAKGYKKLYKEMSAADKLLVRQEYFLEQTSMAAGDFVKTQDSWANQTRILSEQWKEFMTIIGNGLIQVLTPAVSMLNDFVAGLIDVGQELSNVLGISVASNVSEEVAQAKEEIASIGDTAEETMEKTSGSTASFDNLEVVGGSKSSAGENITENIEAMEQEKEVTVEAEQETSELEKAIQRTGEALGWLGGVFETSFLGTFGDRSAFNEINQSFRELRETVVEVFASAEMKKSAFGFVKSFITHLGSITGTFASIGVSIFDNLLGGFKLSLASNKGLVQNSIISLFDIGARISEIGTKFSKAVSGIFSVFRGDSAKQVTADILSIFTNAFFSTLELVGTFALDVLDLITAPFIENEELIRTTIENTFSSIQPILVTFQNLLQKVFATAREVYDDSIRPMLMELKAGFTEIGKVLLSVYNEYILPVITYAGERFNELANGPLAELVSKFGEFVSKAATMITVLWKKVLQPFITWFVKNIAPVIGKELKNAVDFFYMLGKYVSEIVGFILDILGVLMDFVTTGFTEGWTVAWTNLKNSAVKIFEELWSKLKKIINSILGGIEGMANGAVKGINKVIEALNGLSFDIPDWVPGMGGETFGFSIPKMREVTIPRLATGTVVPANYGEFAAILGDNKRETEVVSPLSTIEKAVENVMARMQAIGGDITLIAQLDGEVIYREVVKRDRIQKKRTGKSELA